MRPSAHRLRASGDFALIQRRGTRITRPTFVVTAFVCPGVPTRVGLSVGKAVGNSVGRHAVSRKLRHVVSPHLVELPSGTQLVIRALPAAASATSADLDAEFVRAIVDLTRKGISA